jgi:hypothetical protein
MSSFRNHRIVIASLFLPTTAVFTLSAPPTPNEPHEPAPLLPATPKSFSLGEATPQSGPTPVQSRTSSFRANAPLRSIVEDLKVSCHSPISDGAANEIRISVETGIEKYYTRSSESPQRNIQPFFQNAIAQSGNFHSRGRYQGNGATQYD